MKPTNATLNAILATRNFFSVDLYQISLAPSATMPVYTIGTAEQAGSVGNTISVTTSAAIPSGSLIIVGVVDGNGYGNSPTPGTVSDGTNTYTCIADTIISSSTTGPLLQAFYTYTASSLSASTNITFTTGYGSDSQDMEMVAFYVAGANSAAPVDAATIVATGSAALRPTASNQQTYSGELMIGILGLGSGATGATPFTQRYGWTDIGSTQSARSIDAAYLPNASSPVTYYPRPASVSSNYGAIVFGIKPAYAQSIFFYAQGQTDITYNSITYKANGQTGPYFDRKDNKAKVIWRLGSGTDQLIIDVIPGSSTIINNVPFLSAVRAGVFDGADFQLSRAFMSSYGTVPSGCAVLMFQGRVAEVDADRSLATFTINDYRELLSQQLPRNLFAPTCANVFGDIGCTVNVWALGVSGTVASNTTATQILASGFSEANGYFNNGKVIFTSGQLNTLAFGVSTYVESGGTFNMVYPLPIVPNVGDTFVAYPGCDHTYAGGCTTYSNTANFRGEPFIPAPEAAL